MVCLGNICRSPLAEELLRKKANESGLKIEVDSAGTESYHVGEQPDLRTRDNAKTHGIDLSHIRARQFSTRDFDYFDKIYVADSNVMREVMALARDHRDIAKVDYLLNVLDSGLNRVVPDPYYGNGGGFEQVFRILDEVCGRIVELIQNNRLK